MLDLFSGTGSVGKYFKKLGFNVISVDNEQKFEPDICCDVLKWDYKDMYPKGFFTVIAAGVPCTEYSMALTTRPRDMESADKLVEKTLEIIDYFEPPIWWIENPRNGRLKTRKMMKELDFLDVDYCQFSDWGYQKPTRIWGSPQIASLPDKFCDLQTCDNMMDTIYGGRKHFEQLGGNKMKFSTIEKYRIPTTLSGRVLVE